MEFTCAMCQMEREEETPFVPGDFEESLRHEGWEYEPEIICELCQDDYPGIAEEAAQAALDAYRVV